MTSEFSKLSHWLLMPHLLILLITVGPSAVLAQSVDPKVCTETTKSDSLPAVPPRFHASMSMNSGGTLGYVAILADANSSRSAVTFGTSATDEFKAIFDSATNQILVIDNIADQFDIENCQVQNASASSFTSLMAKVSFRGTDRIIPTGKIFNGAGLKINRSDNGETINDIAARRYTTCHFASSIQMTLEVTWWFDEKTNTPVQIKTKYGPTEGPAVERMYYPSQLRKFSEKHDATKHALTAPRGVYCKGLISAKQAPSTYDRFGFGNDRYTYNLPGNPAMGPDSFRESYDLRSNLSMIEGEGTTLSLDKSKFGSGRLARINDFTRGISYVKNMRYENCTYEKIPQNDWDSNPSPDGAIIKTADEFYFPGLSQLQYKGTGVFRSKDVDVYIGYKDNYLDIGDGKKYPMTFEYYLDIRTSYDGEGNPNYKSIPMAAYLASTSKYNALVEIFDFDTGIPRAYDHDISDCFAAMQKEHFELILSIDQLEPTYVKYLDNYRADFMYALVSSVSKALNISPLRIIQPMVSVFSDPMLVLVEITVTDRAVVQGYTPKQPEIPLSQVAPTLTALTSKGTLFVEVLEGDLMFQVPIKDFSSLDSRGSDSSNQGGLSTGAIAGLAIGMLLLGIALGVGVIFAVGYFRKDRSLLGFKPFDASEGA